MSQTVRCIFTNQCLICSDINECTQNDGICGLGTCSVTSDGLYDCNCQDGAMRTGDSSEGTLTCDGMLLVSPKLELML